MKYSFLIGGNPVLNRELRAALRNARSFALISLYVAILGALVISQFPAGVALDMNANGATKGRELMHFFVRAQALLILVMLPALSSGTLSQERERLTLEPLLLTPLTPLQIVWGKAVGVLALTSLLILSTVPLTSLCFLLGGFSPSELIAFYAILFGLALFTTSIGLYCSARWKSVQATVFCYLLLPLCLPIAILFSSIGVVATGVMTLVGLLYLVTKIWNRWGENPLPRRLGGVWRVLLWGIWAIVAASFVVMLLSYRDLALIALGLFIVLYWFAVAQLGLQQAAREIVRSPEPSQPLREKVQDIKAEWQDAVAPTPIYLPEPGASGSAEYSPNPAPRRAASTPTYGVQPFLSDRLNPILAKDLRTGLLGKFDYVLRFSYVITIGTELLLIMMALLTTPTSASDEQGYFRNWAIFHFLMLLIGGVWLGARSIAPEHEQQTLPQLLTTPLRPAEIVQGKIMAVMAYTFYVFVMGLPLAILLPSVKIVPWSSAMWFVAIEIVFGAFAAAWGIYCSLNLVTVRRALGVALGGLFCVLMMNVIFSLLQGALSSLFGVQTGSVKTVLSNIATMISPINLMSTMLSPLGYSEYGTVHDWAPTALLSLLLYAGATVGVLMLTARSFKRYAQNI